MTLLCQKITSSGFRRENAHEGKSAMRKKAAFSESKLLDNLGMLVFTIAALAGLWYLVSNLMG